MPLTILNKLTSIYIPNSVTEIGENAFSNTNKLNSISMFISLKDGINKPWGLTPSQYDNIDWRPIPFEGIMLNKAAVVALGWDKKETITLDDWINYAPNVTGMEGETFANVKGLKTIYIPDKLTFIAFKAFQYSGLENFIHNNKIETLYASTFRGCSKMVNFSWPTLAKEIPEYMFEGCISLTTITGIEGITSIKRNAFSSTNLTSINIPNSVVEIGDDAFLNTQITDRNKLTLPSKFDTPEELKRIGFQFKSSSKEILLTSNSLNNYNNLMKVITVTNKFKIK